MNKTNLLIFGAGLSIGAFSSWCFTKKKYEKIAQEEISEMRSFYKKKQEELSEKNKTKPPIEDISQREFYEEKPEIHNIDIRKLNQIVEENGYEEKEVSHTVGDSIIMIDDGEFASYNGYEKLNLVLYSDDVLADEVSDDIYLIDDTIGLDAADILKLDRPEAVYVRNEETQTEYEVTWDNRTYGEVTGIFMKDDD